MGRSRSKTQKAKSKPRARRFVSHATSGEMRSYQTFASKYPPLPHEDFVRYSKQFMAGRDAKVELEEEQVIDGILGGDWSEENARAKESEIDGEFSRIIDGWVPQNGMMGDADGMERMPRDEWQKLSADYRLMRHDYLAFVNSRHHTRTERRHMQVTANKGQEALETMVNHNLQFAMSRVGRYKRANNRAKRIGFAEMLSVANIGLIMAARQFDPSQGRKFTTYATYHIDGQILDLLAEEDGNIGIKGTSGHEQKQIIEIDLLTSAYVERYRIKPTDEEIGSLEGVPASTVETRRSTVQVSTQSIYMPGQGEDEKEVFIPDLIQDGGNDVEDDIADDDRRGLLGQVHDMLGVLDEKPRKAIVMMMGMEPDKYDGPQDASKVAAALGMSVKEVNAMVKKALERLRLETRYRQLDFDDILGEER